MRAVELYLKYGLSAAAVINELEQHIKKNKLPAKDQRVVLSHNNYIMVVVRLSATIRHFRLQSKYRELYTQCYNVLEAATKSTLEAGVLGGIAFAGKALGKAVEKTPIGDRTQIDETLIGASEAVANKRDELSVKQTGLLIAAKENVTLPFSDGIDRISYLYNQEFELLMDAEAMYLLPA